MERVRVVFHQKILYFLMESFYMKSMKCKMLCMFEGCIRFFGYLLDSVSSEKNGRSISYLSTLLDKDDRAVRIAAGEAIALIFEIASLKLFSGESLDDNLDVEGKVTPGAFASLLALRGKILQQVKTLSVEASGKGLAKKDLSSQRNLFRDIVDYIEVIIFSWW